MPTDKSSFIAAIERLGGEAYVPNIVNTAIACGIDTPLRQAHWLAQMAHESGGFCFLREIWGPTKQQRRYERDPNARWPTSSKQAKLPGYETNRLAYQLGNERPGDGFRYRGRGFIGVTGRENYTSCSLALHGDERLVHHPELLEQEPAASAGWYWMSRAINRFADRDDVVKVTQAINGGKTGLDDRVRRLAIAKQAMEAAFRSAATATN